jgi:hypothetical protein
MTEEETIAELHREQDAAMEAVNAAQARLNAVNERLAEIEPPFEVGDAAYVNQQGRRVQVFVLACERAFGEWVVKVEFDNSRGTKAYYYPASALE